jgi:hypothetical protein
MTNTAARFQVTETTHGYAVKDTRDDSIWTHTYRSTGWAARAAMKLNDLVKNHKYSR